MNVRNCRKCGNLFNYSFGPCICPACKDAQEAEFQRVKKYIQEHPNCGIKEVADECEVEVAQIQQWLREERLQFAEGSMIMLTCESCGCEIRSGRFCDKCKNNMANGFKQAIAKPEEPKPIVKDVKDSPKMRFLS